jgi:hypothetical protein
MRVAGGLAAHASRCIAAMAAFLQGALRARARPGGAATGVSVARVGIPYLPRPGLRGSGPLLREHLAQTRGSCARLREQNQRRRRAPHAHTRQDHSRFPRGAGCCCCWGWRGRCGACYPRAAAGGYERLRYATTSLQPLALIKRRRTGVQAALHLPETRPG